MMSLDLHNANHRRRSRALSPSTSNTPRIAEVVSGSGRHSDPTDGPLNRTWPAVQHEHMNPDYEAVSFSTPRPTMHSRINDSDDKELTPAINRDSRSIANRVKKSKHGRREVLSPEAYITANKRYRAQIEETENSESMDFTTRYFQLLKLNRTLLSDREEREADFRELWKENREFLTRLPLHARSHDELRKVNRELTSAKEKNVELDTERQALEVANKVLCSKIANLQSRISFLENRTAETDTSEHNRLQELQELRHTKTQLETRCAELTECLQLLERQNSIYSREFQDVADNLQSLFQVGNDLFFDLVDRSVGNAPENLRHFTGRSSMGHECVADLIPDAIVSSQDSPRQSSVNHTTTLPAHFGAESPLLDINHASLLQGDSLPQQSSLQKSRGNSEAASIRFDRSRLSRANEPQSETQDPERTLMLSDLAFPSGRFNPRNRFTDTTCRRMSERAQDRNTIQTEVKSIRPSSMSDEPADLLGTYPYQQVITPDCTDTNSWYNCASWRSTCINPEALSPVPEFSPCDIGPSVISFPVPLRSPILLKASLMEDTDEGPVSDAVVNSRSAPYEATYKALKKLPQDVSRCHQRRSQNSSTSTQSSVQSETRDISSSPPSPNLSPQTQQDHSIRNTILSMPTSGQSRKQHPDHVSSDSQSLPQSDHFVEEPDHSVNKDGRQTCEAGKLDHSPTSSIRAHAVISHVKDMKTVAAQKLEESALGNSESGEALPILPSTRYTPFSGAGENRQPSSVTQHQNPKDPSTAKPVLSPISTNVRRDSSDEPFSVTNSAGTDPDVAAQLSRAIDSMKSSGNINLSSKSSSKPTQRKHPRLRIADESLANAQEAVTGRLPLAQCSVPAQIRSPHIASMNANRAVPRATSGHANPSTPQVSPSEVAEAQQDQVVSAEHDQENFSNPKSPILGQVLPTGSLRGLNLRTSSLATTAIVEELSIAVQLHFASDQALVESGHRANVSQDDIDILNEGSPDDHMTLKKSRVVFPDIADNRNTTQPCNKQNSLLLTSDQGISLARSAQNQYRRPSSSSNSSGARILSMEHLADTAHDEPDEWGDRRLFTKDHPRGIIQDNKHATSAKDCPGDSRAHSHHAGMFTPPSSAGSQSAKNVRISDVMETPEQDKVSPLGETQRFPYRRAADQSSCSQSTSNHNTQSARSRRHSSDSFHFSASSPPSPIAHASQAEGARCTMPVESLLQAQATLRDIFDWVATWIQYIATRLYPIFTINWLNQGAQWAWDQIIATSIIELPAAIFTTVIEALYHGAVALLTFVQWVRKPASWQWLRLLVAALCLCIVYLVSQLHQDWYTANTSSMREKIMAYREDHWEWSLLQKLRWYLQLVIERRCGTGRYVNLS